MRPVAGAGIRDSRTARGARSRSGIDRNNRRVPRQVCASSGGSARRRRTRRFEVPRETRREGLAGSCRLDLASNRLAVAWASVVQKGALTLVSHLDVDHFARASVDGRGDGRLEVSRNRRCRLSLRLAHGSQTGCPERCTKARPLKGTRAFRAFGSATVARIDQFRTKDVSCISCAVMPLPPVRIAAAGSTDRPRRSRRE